MASSAFDGLGEQVLREAQQALGAPPPGGGDETFVGALGAFAAAIDWKVVRRDGGQRGRPWSRVAVVVRPQRGALHRWRRRLTPSCRPLLSELETN